MPRDLHELSRLEDSLSYLYVERAVIERDENSIIILREGERVPVPISSLTVLMLGPGTNITHAAMQVAAESGCMVVWCGEGRCAFMVTEWVKPVRLSDFSDKLSIAWMKRSI